MKQFKWNSADSRQDNLLRYLRHIYPDSTTPAKAFSVLFPDVPYVMAGASFANMFRILENKGLIIRLARGVYTVRGSLDGFCKNRI